jgi:predicted transcriptional regulator
MPGVQPKRKSSVKRERTVRRSITLPAELDAKVKKIARRMNNTSNRVMETLLEAGIAAKEAERKRFFEIAEALQSASNPKDAEAAKRELSRMVFGE